MARIARIFPAALLLLLAVLAASPARAQQEPTPPAVPPLPALDNAPPDMSEAKFERDMAKQRNVQRQKEIVADTNRLLDLAKQLKAAVDKSNKDQLSLSVVDTANEIEKLAKSVKEKMRDGD